MRRPSNGRLVHGLRAARRVDLQGRGHGLPRGSGDPRAPLEAPGRRSRRSTPMSSAQRLHVKYDAAKLTTGADRRSGRADRHARLARARGAAVQPSATTGARARLVAGIRASLSPPASPLPFAGRRRRSAGCSSRLRSSLGRHSSGPPRLGVDPLARARHQRPDGGRGRRRDRARRMVRRRRRSSSCSRSRSCSRRARWSGRAARSAR